MLDSALVACVGHKISGYEAGSEGDVEQWEREINFEWVRIPVSHSRPGMELEKTR